MTSFRVWTIALLCGAVLTVSGCVTIPIGWRTVDDERRLSDAEIAGVVHALNREVIRTAQLGQQRAISGFTVDYARRLIRAHALAARRLEQLVATERLALAPSPLADELIASLEQSRAVLADIELVDFDETFFAAEVRVHRRLYQVVDEQLLPSADSWVLRGYLRELKRLLARQVLAGRYTYQRSPLVLAP